MKRILILLALIVVGATSAQAQIRIGLNGIELYSEPQDSLSVSKSKAKSSSSSYSSSYYNTKKSKVKYYSALLNSNLSSIPMVECGWNVLQGVDYAPYAGMEVGEFFDGANEILLLNGLQDVVDAIYLEGSEGILIVGGGEDDRCGNLHLIEDVK